MMWRAARTWWKYLGAKAHLHLEETADPKVQLEQAITEARAISTASSPSRRPT